MGTVADCNAFTDPLGCVVGGAVGSAVNAGAEGFGEEMMGGWDALMKQFLTSWLDVGLLVSLEGDSVTWLTSQLQVVSVFFAVIGIMIAALWTMIHFRGDKAVKVAKALLTVMLVTTLGTAVVQLVINVGDLFSDWVLESAGVTADSFGNVAAATTVALIGPGLAIIAGIFGIVATGLQWLIMLIRATVLPLLVAVWPLAASASMINGSEEAFSKLTKWMVAFILYKPAAAIVYAFAWRLKSGDEGIGGVMNGLLLLILAVVALPALMRLIAPGTSALGGAAGGSIALAAGAAAGSAAVSAGAMILTGGGSAAATAGGAAGTAGTVGAAGTASTAADTAGTAGGGGGGAAVTGGSGSGGGSTAEGTSTSPGTSGAGSETPSAPAGGSSLTGGDSGGGSGGESGGGSGSSAVTAAGSDAPGGAGDAIGTGGAGQEGTASTTGGTSGTAGGASGAADGAVNADGGGASSATVADGSSGNTASGNTPQGSSPVNGGTTDGPAATPPAGGSSGNSSSGAARAALDSMGGSVADGAKDADGKDVIGG